MSDAGIRLSFTCPCGARLVMDGLVTCYVEAALRVLAAAVTAHSHSKPS